MAVARRILDALRNARDAAAGFIDRYFNYGEPKYLGRLNDRVSDLRRIPADDRQKKEMLAAYFQSPEGQIYTADEKKNAYDDLLGVERNKEHRG